MLHNAPLPRGVRTFGSLTIDNVKLHHRGIDNTEGFDKTDSWHLVLDELVWRIGITGDDVGMRKRWVLEELVP